MAIQILRGELSQKLKEGAGLSDVKSRGLIQMLNWRYSEAKMGANSDVKREGAMLNFKESLKFKES